MRKTIVLTLLSVANATSVSALSDLDALSMIETGNDDRAIGAAGEVSRFQIKPHLWRIYSPVRNYRNSNLAREVAGRMLADLETDFKKRAGRVPTDFDRYVLWNAGPTYYARIGFSQKRVSKVVRERAVRYSNLCQLNEPAPSASPMLAEGSSRPAASRAKTQPPQPLEPTTASAQIASLLPEGTPEQMEFSSLTLSSPPPASFGNRVVVHPLVRPTQGVLALGGVAVR